MRHATPPPPLQTPTPCNPPPPRETVNSMFFWLTCIVLVCVAHLLYACPCIAFPLLQMKHLCVFCDILSSKALYGCCVATSDPRCFLPVTMYGTTHAHLVHMCWPFTKWATVLPHSVHTLWWGRSGGS